MRILSGFLCGCTLLQADFAYEQKTKMTGGAAMAAMKIAGAFSKKVREAENTWTYVKGNKMATVSGSTASIIDVGAGTMTQVDFDKHTYSVITFEQMAQAMADMKTRMGGDHQTEVNMTVDGKETGRKKQIAGHASSEFLMSFVTILKDKQGKQQSEMETQMSSWMAADLPGYQELVALQKKMGEKMGAALSPAQSMPAMQPGMNESWATLAQKMKNMEGVPMMQIIRMGPKGQLPPTSTMGDPKPVESKESSAAPAPKASDVLAGALGGRLGGFGRKRKTEKEEMPNPQTPAARGEGPSGEGGMLMEMTIETLQVLNGPVDAAKVEVPVGYQQVESEMLKALKKR